MPNREQGRGSCEPPHHSFDITEILYADVGDNVTSTCVCGEATMKATRTAEGWEAFAVDLDGEGPVCERCGRVFAVPGLSPEAVEIERRRHLWPEDGAGCPNGHVDGMVSSP